MKFRSSIASSGTRDILFNIGWLSLDRVVRMSGALLTGTMVARYLGPQAFGMFSLAMALYLLFNTISNVGLDYLVVRDVVLAHEEVHTVLGTAFWIKIIASLISTAIAVSFTFATHSHQSELAVMVALLSVAAISQGWDVIDYFFQAKTLSRRVVIPKLFVFAVINAARIAAIFMHVHVMTFVVIAAAEILLNEVALWNSYRTFPHGILHWTWNRTRAKALLREGFPLMIANLLVMVYMRTDQILLGYFLGNQAVGYYSAATRLSEIWYTIPGLICNSVMPKLLLILANDRPGYYQRLQTIYNKLVLLSIAIALVTVLLGKYVIMLLFGTAYLPSAHILSIHIWTGIFVFIGVLGGQQLIHENKTVIELRRAAAGAIINLALNMLLIPRFGIAGSAWATLFAQFMASYGLDIFSSKTRHMFRMKTYALSGAWIVEALAVNMRRINSAKHSR